MLAIDRYIQIHMLSFTVSGYIVSDEANINGKQKLM